jgi:hypothetical protein
MLAFDHAANFIEHLDHTFIVGDKQGSLRLLRDHQFAAAKDWFGMQDDLEA